jgi:hypothetical protein
MTYSDAIISAAIDANNDHPNDIGAAVKAFTAHLERQGLLIPSNPHVYITYWQGRRLPDGTIEHHATWSGRHKMLTHEQVDRAYAAIVGWEAAGRTEPYDSKEDLVENCAVVGEVLQEAGVTITTLLKAISKLQPGFARSRLRTRWSLSAAQKEERLHICRSLLEVPVSHLDYVVFVDAKSIYMQEKPMYGYVDLTVGRDVRGVTPARHNKQTVVLRYYGAVNAKLGPVLLRFYTGTTTLGPDRDGHSYRVSSALEKLGSALALHILNSLPQCSSPCAGEAAAGRIGAAHLQPQHTVALPHCGLGIFHISVHSGSHAGVIAVGLGHQLCAVALAMHLNHQVCRLEHHNIPPLAAHMCGRAVAHTHTPWLTHSTCLSGILLDAHLLITQCVQSLLKGTVLPRAYAARKRPGTGVACAHPHQHTVLGVST